MKKIIYLLIIMISVSCIKDDEITSRIQLLPINEAITPQNFVYGETDSITVKYSLPNGCHYYHSLYYQYQDTTRIVAIRAVELLDENCTQAVIEREIKFPVKVLQREDYLFKFWKGEDANGNDIFDEIVIPVN